MIGFAVGIFVIMVYVIVDYSLEGNQGDIYRLVSAVMLNYSFLICKDHQVHPASF